MIIHRTALGCALALVALVACSPGAARASHLEPSKGQARLVVRFADLDLATAHGVRELYLRIRGAARSACGVYERPDDLFPSPTLEACEREAIEAAIAAVHAPSLTSYYEARRARAARPLFAAAAR